MAFRKRALTRVATAPVAAGRNCNFYVFATDDPAATVLAAGYFNDSRGVLAVNDRIEIVSVHNGAGDRLVVLVATVPASGNVTVAVNTAASGA